MTLRATSKAEQLITTMQENLRLLKRVEVSIPTGEVLYDVNLQTKGMISIKWRGVEFRVYRDGDVSVEESTLKTTHYEKGNPAAVMLKQLMSNSIKKEACCRWELHMDSYFETLCGNIEDSYFETLCGNIEDSYLPTSTIYCPFCGKKIVKIVKITGTPLRTKKLNLKRK